MPNGCRLLAAPRQPKTRLVGGVVPPDKEGDMGDIVTGGPHVKLLAHPNAKKRWLAREGNCRASPCIEAPGEAHVLKKKLAIVMMNDIQT